MRLLLGLLLVALGLGSAHAAERDYNHVLRIQISVAFDGERVDFDEWVFCGSRVEGTLQTLPTSNPLTKRQHATRVLSDGSMLGFPIAWPLCSVRQDQWRFPGADPKDVYHAPDGYLPPFSWFDHWDPAKKTRGEGYFSEAALKDPNGRLKILTPMEFSVPVHPPTEEVMARAIAEEEAELVRRFHRPLQLDGNLMPITEAEWRDIDSHERIGRMLKIPFLVHGPPDWDRLFSYLDALPSDAGLVPLGEDVGGVPFTSEQLVLSRNKRHHPTHLIDRGVPQTGLKWNGLLENQRTEKIWRTDDSIPLECLGDGNVTLQEGLRGTFLYRLHLCSRTGWFEKVTIDGASLNVAEPYVGAFYGARTKIIYYRD